MHDNLRHHSSQEILVQAPGELELGPVMSVLKHLQRITLEVHLSVKVHLMEGLHGDLGLAMVLGTIMLAQEVQVVLDRTAGILGLFILSRRDGRRNGPVGHQDRDGGENGEEQGCP